ncbi:MAG: hypothetical protein ACLVB1_04925 [Blautia obeum]
MRIKRGENMEEYCEILEGVKTVGSADMSDLTVTALVPVWRLSHIKLLSNVGQMCIWIIQTVLDIYDCMDDIKTE